MAKKMCELCQQATATTVLFGVDLCNNCYDEYSKASQGVKEYVEKFSSSENFPYASVKATSNIISRISTRFKTLKERADAEKKRVETEEQHQAFAKSFGEYYEYDVVTIINEGHGQIDKQSILKVLNERAQQGWKLHTIYSNELGKNAVSLLGLGVNSTACEDVLIFERRVENI